MHLLPARIRIVRQKQLFSAAPLLIDDPFARAPQPYCPHQKKLASRTVAQLQLQYVQETFSIFNNMLLCWVMYVNNWHFKKQDMCTGT